jgi:hypothetical protein
MSINQFYKGRLRIWEAELVVGLKGDFVADGRQLKLPYLSATKVALSVGN